MNGWSLPAIWSLAPVSTTTNVKTFFIGLTLIVAGGHWPTAGAGDLPKAAADSCEGRTLRPWVERAFGKPGRQLPALAIFVHLWWDPFREMPAAMGIHVPI